MGLGCMRLSTAPDRDAERALATVTCALDLGFAWLDTARAYAFDDGELGHNERLIAAAIRAHSHQPKIISKGGMRRPAGAWRPDGRAGALEADCDASLDALGGLPIDLYMLHVPDPAVPFSTSVRALKRLLDRGLVRAIGVSNVSRAELVEAMDLAPISAIEVALGPHADHALKGGVIAHAVRSGLRVFAHAPLGGAKKKRHPLIAKLAPEGVTAEELTLSALARIHPAIVPIPGATRPETVRSIARADALELRDEDRAAIDARFGWWRALAPAPEVPARPGEVVMIMGPQGAGKSSHVAPWVERGYVRLNRDLRGGTLDALHRALGAELDRPEPRVVLDNVYTTRAGRFEPLDRARKGRVGVRGIWLDTPRADLEINIVTRMLEKHGALLEPEALARSKDPALFAPTVVLRTVRELELPELDEGFAAIERIPFTRRALLPGHIARAVAVESSGRISMEAQTWLLDGPPGPRLVFGWTPGRRALALDLGPDVTVMTCPHEGGPPRCWCRPPLPGLLLAFGAQAGVDWSRSAVRGTGPAHRALAEALGAHHVGG